MKALLPAEPRAVRFGTVPEPTPAAGEVVIAVEAYSVNRGETFLLDAPPPGWRPGKDIAGVVLNAAADGSGPAPGTRVVAHAPHSGWAERVAVSTSAVAVLPDDVATTIAAALPLAGLTALRLIRAAGALIGRRVLITGASGGVGHYLTELATNCGADVVAVSANAERGARLSELGATVVTDVCEAHGWFDLTLESVGGATFTKARRRTDPDGVVMWFGQAGLEPITVDFFAWVRDTVGAPIVPFHYERSTRPTADDLGTLVGLVGSRRLHPEIGVLLPWDRTAQVIEDLRARRVRGNAVLEIAY